MFKKIIIASIVFITCSSTVFAVTVEDIKKPVQDIFDLLRESNDEIVVPTTAPTAVVGSGTPQPTTDPNVTEPPNPTLPPVAHSPGCPPAHERLHVAGRYRHLNRRLPCDRPRMLVVHWSAGWSSAQATFDVLNNRDRSCQFAIDENEIIQMLDLYPNAVERGWCAGGDANAGSINFEITGAWFDDVLEKPGTKQYNQLITMTDKTVDLSCKLIQMYGIPKTAIYGHYQLQTGKPDPGVEYLQFFKEQVEETC